MAKKRNIIGDFIVEDSRDKVKVRDIFTNNVIKEERKRGR